jgi:hypothetical protein
VPHRYCDNHFLRDVAKPVLEADSHAKVQMRKKVRGLRKIEQAVLKERRASGEEDVATDDPNGAVTPRAEPARSDPPRADPGGDVVLDYCAAVRGILNDDQGGPLHPPRLADGGRVDRDPRLLSPLPAWVRHVERVWLWVSAKLLINAMRIIVHQGLAA